MTNETISISYTIYILIAGITCFIIGLGFGFWLSKNIRAKADCPSNNEQDLQRISELESSLATTKEQLAHSEAIVNLYEKEQLKNKDITSTLEEERKANAQKDIELHNTITSLTSENNHLNAKVAEQDKILQQKEEEQQAAIAKLTALHEQQKQDIKRSNQDLLDSNIAKYEKLLTQNQDNYNKTNKDIKEQCDQLITTLKTNHEQVVNKLNSDYNERISELKISLSTEKDNLQKQLQSQIDSLTREKSEQKKILDANAIEIVELKKENSSLKANNDALMKMQEQEKLIAQENQEHFKRQISDIGERLLKERGADLEQKNKSFMEDSLKPFKDELQRFNTFINENQRQNSEQSGKLEHILEQLIQSNSSLSTQAIELTNVLKKDSKTQGMWGEFQLEAVLESSGMSKDEQYIREVAFTDKEQDRKGRRDVVVLLPSKRGIVIDAKCSISSYINYVNAEKAQEEETSKQALDSLITSVKNHIKELIDKDYSSYDDFVSPPFVFMFIPIDSVLAIVLKADPKLYTYAQEHKIYMVSPSTLMPALQIVSTLWNLSGQNDKLKAIAKSANNIYNKSKTAQGLFDSVANALESLNKNFEKFQTSFCTGKGNLVSLLRNFDSSVPNINNELQEVIQQNKIEKAIDCNQAVIKYVPDPNAEPTPLNQEQIAQNNKIIAQNSIKTSKIVDAKVEYLDNTYDPDKPSTKDEKTPVPESTNQVETIA